MIILILLFSLVSCREDIREKVYLVEADRAKPISTVIDDPRSSGVIESTFIKYVTEFESLHPDPGFEVTTPISFADIDEENVLGVCITWTSPTLTLKEIQIDRTTFVEALRDDPIAPRTIMFHELGHCELDLPHDSSLARFNGGLIPFTIMFPQLIQNRSIYRQHDDHYMDVLFGGDGLLSRVEEIETFTQTVSLGMKNGYEGSAVRFLTPSISNAHKQP